MRGSSRATLLVPHLALSLAWDSPAFQPYGRPITIRFPNDQTLLGLSGLSYDGASQTWTAPAESIQGLELDDRWPLASVPRLYRLRLDFAAGTAAFASPAAVQVQPGQGLKLEDIAAAGADGSFWVVSEANSHLVQTQQYLSKDFATAPDINTYDPATFAPSKLLRVRASDGAVLESAAVPSWVQWDGRHSWASSECTGSRPFQGLHALSVVPSGLGNGSGTLVVGMQSALYQDGRTPSEFEGSATRLLFYTLGSTGMSNTTAVYSRSYRYDTSHKTMKLFQKGARHFNALFGLLALSDRSLLVAECEDFNGFGYARVINRIFHVELDLSQTVDHCQSFLECNISAPKKRLVWEQSGELQLDGMSWGPTVTVSGRQRPTVALVFENDDKVGAHFELFVLDQSVLNSSSGTREWSEPSGTEALLSRRIWAALASLSLVPLLAAGMVVLLCRRHRADQPAHVVAADGSTTTTQRAAEPWGFKHYVMGTCIANSFLVGGLTFGFPGMVLILRREGHYAQSCACGSFCSKEKEQLALVSVLGFAVAIGSRIFIGVLLDLRGPKITAVASCTVCLVAFLILACTPDGNLGDTFLLAWCLLCWGGSGLHVAGFHATNLFHGSVKTAASAGISASFGAAAIIFPLMQALNQYTGATLQYMSMAYAAIVLLVGLNNFLVQPWDKVQAGVPLLPDFHVWRGVWWRRADRGKTMIVGLRRIVATFDFWGEMLFYSISMLFMTHYLSTAAQLMYEKGDVPFTNNPNDWTDYMFTRLVGIFNSLGFLWYPLVEFLLQRYTWATCFLVLAVANMAFLAVILVPVLEVQIIGFILQSGARLMLFSFHHTYLLDKFGIEYFGVLNGLSSLFAAAVGLLSYPLQLLAVSYLRGSFALSFVPVGVCLLLGLAFPARLWRKPVSNWAETAFVDPRKFRRPTSVEGVVATVSCAEKVRCAGAMHSCAPLIACEGIIISLDRMDRILEIDAKRQRVRVQAGVHIHELCEALAPYGLALGTLGTIDWQTVVGAVMTGTHGGSLTTPSLHAFMEAYTMVTAEGKIVEVRRDDQPRLFAAMAPSMGVFGVVVEAEMRCVPLQHLEARLVAVPFKDLIHRFTAIMTENKYARVVVYPTIGQATVWTANPVKPGDAVAAGATAASGYMNFRDEREKAWLEEFLWHSKRKSFDRADSLLQKVMDSQLQRLAHYEGQYNHVLCKERNHGIPHADMELGFSFSRAEDVLKAAFEFCKDSRMPYYNFEVRATQEDDAMLSCCHGRDTMWIDFQAKAGDNWKFFGQMEDLFAPIGYRKHWAKGMDHTNPQYIMQQYPMLSEFLALVEEHDPNGKFRNDHVELWLTAQKSAKGQTPAAASDVVYHV